MQRTARSVATLAGAVVAILIGGSIDVAAAAPSPQRTLLRTGEVIAQRGQIGRPSASALGIDGGGRILVGSPLSDGTQALAWADARGLELVWRTADEGPRIEAHTAKASASGVQILALGDPLPYDFGYYLPYDAVYQLQPGGPQRRLGIGDVLADGWVVVAVRLIGGVADDGSAAVLADVRSPAGAGIVSTALVSLTAGGGRLIVGDSDDLPAERRFYFTTVLAALPGDGVIFNGHTKPDGTGRSGVYRDDAGTLTAVLAVGDRGPDGAIVDDVLGWAANAAGEVLLRACPPGAPSVPVLGSPDCPTYRSHGGAWIRVRDALDRAPDGRLTVAEGGYLNARGDVQLGATWLSAGETATLPTYGALYYPARGSAQVIAMDSSIAISALNDRGEVALSDFSGGISRWSSAGRQAVVTRSATTPDGLRLIGGGIIGEVCLGDDGRVATRVAFADGAADWVCIDDAGAHVLPRPPAGSESLALCAFAGEDLAVLSGGTIARLDGRRATPILRRGDRLPDGSTLVTVGALAANGSGAIAAAVSSAAGEMVIRQERGGNWQPVDLAVGGADPPSAIGSLHLTASGRIVAQTLSSANGARAVVAVDPDGAGRILARDYQDSAGMVRVSTVHARGDVVLVQTNRSRFGGPVPRITTLTTFDAGTGRALSELDSTSEDADTLSFAGDVGADSSILVGEATTDLPRGFLLFDDGVSARFTPVDRERFGDAVPVALTSSTEVLFRAWRSSAGAVHDALSTSAPRIAGVCPAPATTAGSASGGGCNLDARPRQSVCLSLAGLLSLALAVMRGTERRGRGWTRAPGSNPGDPPAATTLAPCRSKRYLAVP